MSFGGSHNLTDEVFRAPRLDARAAGGDPTYGVVEKLNGYVEFGLKLEIDPNGNEKQSTHRIYTDVEIGLQDRVWVPGDDETDNQESRHPINTRTWVDPNKVNTLHRTSL